VSILCEVPHEKHLRKCTQVLSLFYASNPNSRKRVPMSVSLTHHLLSMMTCMR